MINSIIFIIFVLYATAIFFINDSLLLLGVLIINILIMIILRLNITDAIKYILKMSLFILLTVLINLFLSDYKYAILVAIKLILVCNITYIYSKTTTVRKIALTIKNFCIPLKVFKINPDDIELLVCISLSMIPILKKEYRQIKEACISKGMKINIKNMRIILAKIMISIMKRVNEIEESIIEKGYIEEI